MFGWDFGGWMVFTGIFMIAFIALVIWGIAWLFRSSSGRFGLQFQPSAKDILDRRLAKGEIGEDEYRSRLALIDHTVDRQRTPRSP